MTESAFCHTIKSTLFCKTHGYLSLWRKEGENVIANHFNDNGRDIRSHSGRRSKNNWDDRYTYVEDIYSGSDPTGNDRDLQPKNKKNKRKMRTWKKVVITISSMVLAILVILGVAVGLLFARLNVEQVDTDQYVETPAEVAGIELMRSSGVMNVLVIGADRDQDGSEGRSDTMMLISMGPGGMKMVSFLRDLYVDIPGYGKDRLNAAYSYGGPGMLMQTIENNFRVEVDKYLETNFAGFEEIIDALGGIEVTMTPAEAEFINDWKQVGAVEGKNMLNGKNALYFARMRKLDSDFGRTTRQRQVVSAMFSKLRSSNPFTMYMAAYQLMPNLRTNLSYFELIQFMLSFAGMGDANSLSVPSDGTYYDYTTPEGAMVLVPYYEQNINLLRAFLYE